MAPKGHGHDAALSKMPSGTMAGASSTKPRPALRPQHDCTCLRTKLSQHARLERCNRGTTDGFRAANAKLTPLCGSATRHPPAQQEAHCSFSFFCTPFGSDACVQGFEAKRLGNSTLPNQHVNDGRDAGSASGFRATF